MSDVMLHGVLNMPPECWDGSMIDMEQRYSRYLEASRRIEDLQRVIQMCFDDICKPSGKISKKTARELMKYADIRA